MRRFGFEGVILVVWKGETPPTAWRRFSSGGEAFGMGKVLVLRRGFWGWEGMGRILDWEVLV